MFLLTVLDGTGRTLVRPIDGPTSIDTSTIRGVAPCGPWLIHREFARGGVSVRTPNLELLTELHPGQRCQLGDVTLLLTHIEASPTDQIVMVPRTSALELRIPGRRPVALSERPLLVGSWHGCDVVIDDPSVSHRHCEITPFGDAWAVWDLASTNGLRVGGARVPYATLVAGACVTLGRTVLECAPVGEATEPRSLIVGSSTAIVRLRARIATVADAPYAVLIEGESGVGKELVAREVHAQSARRTGPMVSVNCGAIAPELIESELFGHERGAFSGAAARRRGLFEEAHEGTLFLDEIGELPLALQPKLLRVLETGEIRRVGGEGKTNVRVRVVSATLRDLEARVRDGHFREDLFFRLQDMRVKVPPLRERVGDIPALCEALLRRIGDETGRRRTLEDRALGRLMLWHWPGNVRELFAVLKRAVFSTRASVIGALDVELPDTLPHLRDEPVALHDNDAPRPGEIPHGDLAALHTYCNGNLSRVASLAGIARSTVRARLAKARAAGWSGTP
jgi:DNA-binding NtrC family response regulator